MPGPSESNNTRFILIGLAVVAVAAVVVFALLQTPPVPATAATVAAATPTPAETPAALSSAAPMQSAVAAASPSATPLTGDSPAWESTIDQVLRSNVSEAQMAQMLIAILPTLPEDGQIEAANHITNLLPDENYASARPLLLNASLPESVLSVFFTDLMNRDDPIKLNAFLDIAQIPNHPMHDEALSDLQIYVGDDYGSDWSKWKSAVTEYLKTAAENN